MIFELKEARNKKRVREGEEVILTGMQVVTMPCVIKLVVGKRYMIIKCKELSGTIGQIHKAIKNNELGRVKEDNIYFSLLKYMSRTNQEKGIIHVIKATHNPFKLLCAEQSALDKSKGDPQCLNGNDAAYIPQYNETTKQYGWITKDDVTQFQKWLKKREKPKVKKPKLQKA